MVFLWYFRKNSLNKKFIILSPPMITKTWSNLSDKLIFSFSPHSLSENLKRTPPLNSSRIGGDEQNRAQDSWSTFLVTTLDELPVKGEGGKASGFRNSRNQERTPTP